MIWACLICWETLDWCHNALREHFGAVDVKCGGDLPEVVRNSPGRILMSTSFVEGMESFRIASDMVIRRTHGSWHGSSVQGHVPTDHPDRAEEAKNSQPRVVRGSTSFQGSGQTRNSYRTIYSPNFGNWGAIHFQRPGPWTDRRGRSVPFRAVQREELTAG